MATLYTQADSNSRKTFLLIFVFVVVLIALGWLFSYLLNDNIFLIM
jgi:preprotein translocase subunit SecG